jgi:hypothetical protein
LIAGLLRTVHVKNDIPTPANATIKIARYRGLWKTAILAIELLARFFDATGS